MGAGMSRIRRRGTSAGSEVEVLKDYLEGVGVVAYF